MTNIEEENTIRTLVKAGYSNEQIAEILKNAKTDYSKSKDKTIGMIGKFEEPKHKEAQIGEALVLEVAETGKGFAIYADTKLLDKNRFKRLVR